MRPVYFSLDCEAVPQAALRWDQDSIGPHETLWVQRFENLYCSCWEVTDQDLDHLRATRRLYLFVSGHMQPGVKLEPVLPIIETPPPKIDRILDTCAA